eukprot:240625_1
MTSKYSFPTLNQMNPMLPSVSTPVGTATPKTTNPFDSAMTANGLNFTVQQIVSAQKANAGIAKGAISTSSLIQLNQLQEYLKSFDAVTVVDSGEIICDTFPTGTTISQFGKTKDVMNALTQFSQLDNR